MELSLLSMLENSFKLLYLLNESGSSTFTNLVKDSGLSRNTVSKYLKQLQAEGQIKKEIVLLKSNRNSLGYSITEQGINVLNSRFVGDVKSNWLSSISAKNEALEKLRSKDLIPFSVYSKEKTYLYQIDDRFFNVLNDALNILEFGCAELGSINKIVAQIGRFASKFGERFFERSPDILLHLSVIFIFFNSLENPQFHIGEEQFIEIYGQIDEDFSYSLNDFNAFRKIFLNNFAGNKLLEELELIFSKQEQNKKTGAYKKEPYLRALKNVELKIQKRMEKKGRKTNVDVNIEILNYQMKYLNFIKIKFKMLDEFKNTLDSIVHGNYGINYFVFKYESYYFHEKDAVGSFLNRRINDALTEEYINSKIFEMKESNPLVEIAEEIADEMETLHLIWLEIKIKFKDVVLEKLIKEAVEFKVRTRQSDVSNVNLDEIKGFCPVCGKRIMIDFDECEFCKTSMKDRKLVFDIKEAKRIAGGYKAESYLEQQINSAIYTYCKCGNLIARSWNICPRCKEKRLTP